MEAQASVGQYLNSSDRNKLSEDLSVIARVIAPAQDTPTAEAFISSTLCTWVTNMPSKEKAAVIAGKNLAVICGSCALRRMCTISQVK